MIGGKVAANAIAKALGFANVDDPRVRVFVKIHSRREGELRDLFKKLGRHL
jgi:hypothetical protein